MFGSPGNISRNLNHSQVSEDTVHLIAQHLEHFETDSSVLSADFVNTSLVLLKIQALNVQTVIQLTSTIHSLNGNIAYDLLCATESLLELASLVLKGESAEAYKLEKLQKVESHLADAKKPLLSNKFGG
jgi:hypothetical protein